MSVPQVEHIVIVFLVLDFVIEKKNKFLRIRLKAEGNPGEKIAKSQNLVLMNLIDILRVTLENIFHSVLLCIFFQCS